MRFVRELEIDGARESIFDLTQDYERRLDWDPFLREARLLDGATSAQVGVKALCVDRKGHAMEVVYIAFDRPAVAAIKMTRGPLFLHSFAGTWRFTDAGAGRTRVLFKYFYRLRWPFGAFAGRIERAFSDETGARLTALRDYLRSARS
jgi:hypothetical protein